MMKTTRNSNREHGFFEEMMATLQSTLRLLECPEDDTPATRVHEKLDSLLRLASRGIMARDLSTITKLNLIIFEKIPRNPIYLKCFFKLIEMCTHNIVFLKSSEMLLYAADLTDHFSTLGYLIGSSEDKHIVQTILKSIVKVLELTKNRPLLEKDVVFNALANSQLPSILGELLLVVSDFELYVSYLSDIQKMLVNESVCRGFIKAQVLNTVLEQLCHKWKDYLLYTDDMMLEIPLPRHMSLTQKVLWSLCLVYRESPPAMKCDMNCKIKSDTWRSSRSTLMKIIQRPHGKYIRNVFYVLLRALVASVPFENLPKFATDLHFLAFASERPHSFTWAGTMNLTTEKLDFDFKVLLMSILCFDINFPETPTMYRKMQAIEGIFCILDIKETVLWLDYQRFELMKWCLIGLNQVLRHVPDDFITYSGPKKLLRLIGNILNLLIPFNLLQQALYAVNSSLSIREPFRAQAIEEYRQFGIFKLFSDVLNFIHGSPRLAKPLQHHVYLCYFVLKKIINQSDDELINLIKISIHFLKRFLNPYKDDPFLDPFTLIPIMDFIWTNVVDYENDLSHFVSYEGIYVLLDVIEKFPLAIKLYGLGIVCDLCEKPECLSCILTWRGKNYQPILPFLLQIYKEQVDFDRNFYYWPSNISSAERPFLNNKHLDIKRKYYHYGNTSISTLETLGSCKPKIYAILKMLNCTEYLSLIDENYKISCQALGHDEKVIALAAENYFPLKIGETWKELYRQMGTSGIKPLLFDQELIAYKLKEHHKRTTFIKRQHKLYLEEETKNDIKVEMELYDKLREEALAESLDALKEMEYQARCVKNAFRTDECFKIVDGTKDVFKNEMKEESILIGYHKTVPDVVKNTTIFKQILDIKSNVVITINKEELPHTVSSKCITEECSDKVIFKNT